MLRPPRTLAEIDGLIFRGELPPVAAAMYGGSHVWQLGAVLFVLCDPERFPVAVRPAVQLRNVGLVLGSCPHCGALRPALATSAGVDEVRFPRDLHADDCPASGTALARAFRTRGHQ